MVMIEYEAKKMYQSKNRQYKKVIAFTCTLFGQTSFDNVVEKCVQLQLQVKTKFINDLCEFANSVTHRLR